MSRKTPVQLRAPRTGEGGSLARIRIDGWRSAYRGIVPDDYLDAMNLEENTALAERAIANQDGSVKTIVAAVENVIAGYAVTKAVAPDDGVARGELKALYVAPASQRDGIGALLLQRAISDLSKDHDEMIVWCLNDNPIGRNFYEKHGGQLMGAPQPFALPDAPEIILEEVGYRWCFD